MAAFNVGKDCRLDIAGTCINNVSLCRVNVQQHVHFFLNEQTRTKHLHVTFPDQLYLLCCCCTRFKQAAIVKLEQRLFLEA